MKNIRIILYILFFSTPLFGGNLEKVVVLPLRTGFKIVFSEQQFPSRINKEGNYIIRDYYEATDFVKVGELKLPSISFTLAVPVGSKPTVSFTGLLSSQYEKSIPALNPMIIPVGDSSYRTELIPFSEAKFSDEKQQVVVSSVYRLRDFYCIDVQLFPVLFNRESNVIIEYNSFEVNIDLGVPITQSQHPLKIKSSFENSLTSLFINSDYCENFRSTTTSPLDDSTGNWIDYSAQYLKFKVGKDGIYRIKPADLITQGISITGIDPRTFRMFSSGRQYPVHIEGETDGSFDATDFIEFTAKQNYNKNYRSANSQDQSYVDYYNKFSDSTIFFLTWGGAAGDRIETSTGMTPGLTDSLTYYTFFEHRETNSFYQQLGVSTVNNQDPEFQPLKSFVWNWIFLGTNSQTFTPVEALPGRLASALYKVVSVGSPVATNSHKIAVKINGTTIDSQNVNRNDVASTGGYFNSDLLVSGSNTFSFTNYDIGLSPNFFSYDWIEYEYPRFLRAYNDSLSFRIRDTLQLVERVIKIADINSTDIVVYKAGDFQKRFTGFQISGGILIFTDTVRPGDEYMVLKPEMTLQPVFEGVKQFVNLRSTVPSAEYFAITHPILKQAAATYVNFIQDEYNILTALCLTNDIFDEFSYGYPNPKGIKDFFAFLLGRTGGTNLSYVTLIGSASYDFNRYFFRLKGYEVNSNLVPSYGEPVSDTWYAMMTPGSYHQSFYIGRLPAKTSDDVMKYLDKHRDYLSQRYDEWNKRALFFSSGDGNNESELLDIRNSNQFIINNYTDIEPFHLRYDHFYKTVVPTSDFGPYTPTYIRNSINEGGLFISYLGHSGTRTWDNSISDPSQLLNKYNKSPLVTDFGCSTNKFAEPDVEAFGALFLNEGQTIAYIANSSLGFTSTSLNVSKYFYETILKDSITNVGEMHYNAKLKMFTRLGSTGVYKIFAYTNLLMGDPVVNLALPHQPNLVIENKSVFQLTTSPDEQTDSAMFNIKYSNLGTVNSDSFTVSVTTYYNNTYSGHFTFQKTLPKFADSVQFSIPIKSKPGEHRIEITLDSAGRINELYEDDNAIVYSFFVASLSIRPIISGEFLSMTNPVIRVINSSLPSETNNLLLQYDTQKNFSQATTVIKQLDTFFTTFDLSNLTDSTRYWVRTGIPKSDTLWSSVGSFLKSNKDVNYLLEDAYSFSQIQNDGLYFDNGLVLTTDTVLYEVISGGGNFSKFGSISKNGVNLLSNTFGWGMGLAIIDSITLQVDTAKTFNFGFDANEATAMAEVIEGLPAGKYAAICVIDDGRTNLSTRLKTAIKTLGAARIDNLAFRYPYILLGRKGASSGTVFERMETDTYINLISFDTTFYKNRSEGSFTTSAISGGKGWNNIIVQADLPSDASLDITGYGIKGDGSRDSLFTFPASSASYTIPNIDTDIYPALQLKASFFNASNGTSPVLNYLGVNWDDLAELGVNYQSVTFLKDTLKIGEPSPISITLGNAGGAVLDTFKVAVYILFPDNSVDTISIFSVNGMGEGERKKYIIDYSGSIGQQNRTLIVAVDPQNEIKEVFEDNNAFSIPFYILADTTKPYVTIKQEGKDFYDGEFIPTNPRFEIGLYDASLLPITDPASMKLFINDNPVEYASGVLEAVFSTSNPKMKLIYTPELSSGTYSLKIEAKDALGATVEQGTQTRTFVVSNEMKLNDLYAYPNPSAGEIYFTFVLGQIPEEAEITVFTIAGRVVRKISIPVSDLKYDFNRIYFNGRDQDGDQLASGTYLYIVKIKGGGKVERETRKLVIVR